VIIKFLFVNNYIKLNFTIDTATKNFSPRLIIADFLKKRSPSSTTDLSATGSVLASTYCSEQR